MNRLPFPAPNDPLPVVQSWLDEAARGQVQRHPNTMTLATATPAGKPSARIVLLKALSIEQGYAVFYTHYGSRKSMELMQNPQAAAVLHWDRLGRQVRFEGRVLRSPEEESDRYFATRPWRSQLNAWSSDQSAPLTDPADLERKARERARELGAPDPVESGPDVSVPPLPRPAFWGGYRLWLEAVELWLEGKDRFHDRIRYERSLEERGPGELVPGPWRHQRLQP